MASSATDSQGKDKDIREKLVKTGHVDVMISVGNNFFYTRSLPCTLWFFDKGKPASLQDKVLFIDARNYYTVVDRTLNEWTKWQLKNLTAIVWLYRGETEKYHQLIADYHQGLKEAAEETERSEDIRPLLADDFTQTAAKVQEYLEAQRNKAKEELAAAQRKEKKALQAKWDEELTAIEEIVTIAKEAEWLVERFGEGEYKDIPGLCKIADKEEIKGKNYSLTPGAYVGVAPVEDDGVDFAERMREIHAELLTLQKEANELMETISHDLVDIGL